MPPLHGMPKIKPSRKLDTNSSDEEKEGENEL